MRAYQIFLLFISLSFVSAAEDWPQWRFGPGRGAVSPHALPAELHLQWTRQLPKAVPAWPASQTKLQFDRAPEPVAAEGKLFVPSSANDSLTAYDTKTGKQLWRFYAEAPIRFAPVATKGRVWFGSDDGYLYCLNAADGALRWKFNGGPRERWIIGNERLTSTWPSRGAPVYRDGKIWFTASIWPFMGIFIHCLDAETGRVIWTNSGDGMNYTVQPHGAPSFATIAPQGHLALTGKHLIVPGGRSSPAVFDADTGKLLHFKYDRRRGHYRVLAGGGQYFVDGGRFLAENGDSLSSARPQLVGPDFVLFADGAKLTAESLQGKVVRKKEKDRKGKEVVRVSYEAKKLWAGQLPGEFSRVQLQAGQQIVASGKGALGVFNIADLQKGKAKPTAEVKIKGEPWTVLAADDRLFVVTLDGRLHCFGGARTEARHHPIPPRAKLPVNPAAAVKVKSWIRSPENATGHGLLLGGADVSVIHELLRQTKLRLTVVEADAAKAASLRKLLTTAGLYGERVSVHHHANPVAFAAPPHFANLVLVDGKSARNLTDASLKNLFQAVRPYGGVLCLENAPSALLKTTIEGANIQWGGNDAVRITRAGALPGAADWSHQYGDAGQSVVSKDQLVKAPLGLLWFGGPSNDKILPRHGHGPSPQVAGGRLFIEGADMIRAVDVYTGRLLWERELKGVGEYYNITGHFPGAGEIGSNYVSLPDAVYVVYGKTILELDAETGRTVKEFKLPKESYFGWLSVQGNYLVTTTDPIAIKLSNKPKKPDAIPALAEVVASRFATGSRQLAVFNRKTGKLIWTRDAQYNFRHNNIALGANSVFVIDSLTDARLKAMRRRGLKPKGKPALYALDIKTGKVRWQTDENVFGTFLNYSTEHDLLLQAGSAFRDRAKDDIGQGMVAYRGANGKILWANQDLSYNGPCLLMKNRILTNGNGGFAIDIKTGQPTGWKYKRMYGCNTAIGSEHLLTFRSGAAGFYDLANDGGTGNWGGFRSSCTANLIPANGILNAPDYTRTCSCAYQMQTSLALIHMPELEYWTFGATAKPGQLAINLGAPGDRRAPDGKLWVEHPSVGGNSAAAPVTIEPANAATFRLHSSAIKGDGLKWVAASGLRGVKTVKLKLEKKGTYRVRLHFLEPDKQPARARQFDIVINGQTLQRLFDITATAGGPRRAVVREFNVDAPAGTIQLDLRPTAGRPAVLSGIEWLRLP